VTLQRLKNAADTNREGVMRIRSRVRVAAVSYLLGICTAALLAAALQESSAAGRAPTLTGAAGVSQLRVFTINRGQMDRFLGAWMRGVPPLRLKHGFRIDGAWVVPERNEFFWVLSYDGPEGFAAKDSAYYASAERGTLDPDPVQFIARAERWFVRPVMACR
jgi:hypothetical protein